MWRLNREEEPGAGSELRSCRWEQQGWEEGGGREDQRKMGQCWGLKGYFRAGTDPVVMYRCESWTIRKAECQRIDVFKLWCWRRLLRVPSTARRSSQSILKEISPGCSLEGLMLKLKLQYFGHLMRRADSSEKPWCWERLRAGGEGDNRGWDGWMASLTQWTWVWVNSGSWWWTRRPGVLLSMGSERVRHDWATELNWTELIQVMREGE